MKRSKSQSIFNFSPQNTFDHGEHSIIGKVTEIEENKRDKDLPKAFMLNRIEPRMAEWQNQPSLNLGSTSFVEPRRVRFKVFPRTFQCSNCSCVNTLRENQSLSKGFNCQNCGNKINQGSQLPLVSVCKCGKIQSISVPKHNKCGNRNVRLDQKGSSLIEAKWHCLDCNINFSDLIAYKCSTCGQQKKIKVHSSSTCYYTQTANFVNMDKGLDRLLRDSDHQLRIITNYLIGESGESSSTPKEEMSESVSKALEKLDMTEEVLKQKEKIEQSKEKTREELKQKIQESFSESKIQELSEELYEYNSIDSEDNSSRSLEGLYTKAKRRKDLRQGQIGKYQEKRDAMNLSEVRLLENFPITSVVYGYTRRSSMPKEGVDLRVFKGNNGGNQLLIQDIDAEAIMVTLDKEKVIEWLIENEVIKEKPEQRLDKWFLENLTGYPYYDKIDPEKEVSRYCLTLLHSLSHNMVNSIDALSGYSKNSLVEYVMPHALTFVVYKRSDTNFNLGSMFTLVEDRFLELSDHMVDESKSCIYDPVCEHDEGGSCEGCLYLSSLSCINGNHNLSRSTLFGGELWGKKMTGYFNV